MKLIDRFLYIKERVLVIRNAWRAIQPRPLDPSKCYILAFCLDYDIDTYDYKLDRIFRKHSMALGYSYDNLFNSVSSSDEDFNDLFDNVEFEIRNEEK